MRFFLKKKKNKGNSWQTESSGKEPKVDKNRRDTQSSTATEPENLPLVEDPCDGVFILIKSVVWLIYSVGMFGSPKLVY